MDRPRICDRSGLALVAIAGLVYAATRATALTPDSLCYATEIRDGWQALNPHHLLFVPAVRSVSLATGLDAVAAGQVHNMLWALVAILATRHVFTALLADRGAATWGAATLACTAGFAGFTTQVEVYVPSLACTLLAFALLVDGGNGSGGRRAGSARIVAAGVLFALAVLYHQGALLAAVALLLLPVGARTRGERVVVRAGALAVAGVATTAAYVVAFAATPASWGLGNFVRFCLHYAIADRPAWGTFDNVTTRGLHLLADSQLRSFVHLRGDEFSPESYVGSIAAGVGLAAVVWRLLRSAQRDELRRRAALFVAAWAVVPWLFVLWWLPREEEYLIATIPPVLAALVLAARRWAGATSRVAWSAVIAMAGWNVAAGLLPRHADAGPDARAAADHARAADAGTIVLCDYPLYANHRFARHPGLPLLVDDPFLALYAGRDASRSVLDTASQVLVPWRLLAPDTRTWHRSARTDPDGWLRVVSWVCDLREGEAGADRSHAAIRRIETPSGAMLRVDPDERRNGDLAALLDELDRLDPGPDHFRAVLHGLRRPR